MNRWWFLRAHRDVCRQNDDLHRTLRQVIYERDDALRERDELRDEIADLRCLHGWLDAR